MVVLDFKNDISKSTVLQIVIDLITVKTGVDMVFEVPSKEYDYILQEYFDLSSKDYIKYYLTFTCILKDHHITFKRKIY